MSSTQDGDDIGSFSYYPPSGVMKYWCAGIEAAEVIAKVEGNSHDVTSTARHKQVQFDMFSFEMG